MSAQDGEGLFPWDQRAAFPAGSTSGFLEGLQSPELLVLWVKRSLSEQSHTQAAPQVPREPGLCPPACRAPRKLRWHSKLCFLL